jgi:hypothetical protein
MKRKFNVLVEKDEDGYLVDISEFVVVQVVVADAG